MTSFAFCGFLDVHFSSNGLGGCWSLAFSIFPIDVIQKSTSDALVYTLMLTVSHAGYAIRKTVVLSVGEPGYPSLSVSPTFDGSFIQSRLSSILTNNTSTLYYACLFSRMTIDVVLIRSSTFHHGFIRASRSVVSWSSFVAELRMMQISMLHEV